MSLGSLFIHMPTFKAILKLASQYAFVNVINYQTSIPKSHQFCVKLQAALAGAVINFLPAVV